MNAQKGFNLSEWALKHRTLMLYFCLVLAAAGIRSYFSLGQAEDPDFTFRVMVVNVQWPGASAHDMEQQVTDLLEKKLQETPGLDYLRSFSRPGEAYIFVSLREDVDPKTVPDAWYQVRKKIGDIKMTLPSGVIGPFFNDEFGDTFGSIYAFTGDGFSHAEVRNWVDQARQRLLHVPGVAKVDLLGVQEQRIYVELSPSRLAALGLDPQLLAATLSAQNSMTPAGDINTANDRVYLRVDGALQDVASVASLIVHANGRDLRLGDIAHIYRDYEDPPALRMHFNGKPAIGLAVSMQARGNIIELGRRLDASVRAIKAELPAGITIQQVSNQPAVVKSAVGEFMETLIEAVAIVLLVSFFSLGLRTGTVVALSIPLVLAIVFMGMLLLGIDLQKISLGALIIALGLLVDDAIISVEMMALKLEQGWDRFRAATFAYTTTAMPMLTGTLVTAAGFLPVGMARSMAGEYVFSMFVVVTLALLVSWLVAVTFVPWLGYLILKPQVILKPHGELHETERDVYNGRFYRGFRRLVTACVTYPKTVIAATLAAFMVAMACFGLVQQQFFPHSTRPEIVVDLWLPEGSSPQATEHEAERFEGLLAHDANIVNITSYIGGGSPRFVLVLDQQMPAPNLAEIVVLTKGLAERETTLTKINMLLEQQFPNEQSHATRIPNGPPVGYPVQFRVSGPDINTVLGYAQQAAAVLRSSPYTRHVNLDWGYQVKALRVQVDAARAQALGINNTVVAQNLQTLLHGSTVTQIRDRDRQVNVVVRGDSEVRQTLARLGSANMLIGSGRYVPLAQLAHLDLIAEDGIVWRRNRYPTITVRADIPESMQGPTVAMAIDPQLNPLRAQLPSDYSIEMGGEQESSAKSQGSIMTVMPLMLLVVVTLLMLQLQSFSRVILVLLTAPLGLIGVTAFLLLFHQPFGFVAMLGVIALAGMIMRNSVILVDQIEQDITRGLPPWQAIIESAVRRFRPIMLTALAAILAMIPLTRSTFWGPMAVSIMGGLFVATLLTLLFLPALYAAWYRVGKPEEARA